MKTIRYWFMHKADAEPGPWQAEPDKIQWLDEASGLPCVALRNRFGAWCGYVGLPEGHPWFGKDLEGVEASAHGGINFVNHTFELIPGEDPKEVLERMLEFRRVEFEVIRQVEGEDKRTFIFDPSDFATIAEFSMLSVVDAGEFGHIWWLGFDLMHAFDFGPLFLIDIRESHPSLYTLTTEGQVYRDLAYVQAECANLAAQAKEAMLAPK